MIFVRFSLFWYLGVVDWVVILLFGLVGCWGFLISSWFLGKQTVGNAWVDLVLCGLCSIRLLVLQFFEEIRVYYSQLVTIKRVQCSMWYLLNICDVVNVKDKLAQKSLWVFHLWLEHLQGVSTIFWIIWQLCSPCGCSWEGVNLDYSCLWIPYNGQSVYFVKEMTKLMVRLDWRGREGRRVE